MDKYAYMRIICITILNITSLGSGFPSHLNENYHPPIPSLYINTSQFFSYTDRKSVGKGVVQVKHHRVLVAGCITHNSDLCPGFFCCSVVTI